MDTLEGIKPLLELLDDPVLVLSSDRIIYMNAAAVSGFGDLTERDFSELLECGPQAGPVEDGAVTARFASREVLLRRVPCGEYELCLLTLRRPFLSGAYEEEQMPRLLDYLTEAMHSANSLGDLLDEQGRLRLVTGDEEEPDPAEAIRSMQHSIARIRRIIFNIKIMQDLESGKAANASASVEFNSLCRDLCWTVDYFTRQRGVELSYEGMAEEAYVLGDRVLLEAMLLNLIENSLMHTAEGGQVRVTLGWQGGGVVLRVDDSGSGIEPGQMSALFKGGENGRGLGLRLVTDLARFFGGAFVIEGRKDQGTCARVFLPASRTPLEEGPQAAMLPSQSAYGSGGMDTIFTLLSYWLKPEDYDQRLMD